jgi:hypothetical protein
MYTVANLHDENPPLCEFSRSSLSPSEFLCSSCARIAKAVHYRTHEKLAASIRRHFNAYVVRAAVQG